MRKPRSPEQGSLDTIVSDRIGETRKRRAIRKYTKPMLEALGENKVLYLHVESHLGNLQMDREDAYYAIGFERGSGTLSEVEKEAVRRVCEATKMLNIAERARVLVAAAHFVEPKEFL